MHIGFLTTEYPTSDRPEGGLANYVRAASHGLVERGEKVTVLALADRSSSWRDGEVDVLWVQRCRLPGALGQFRPSVEHLANAGRLRTAAWRRHRSAPFDILQAASYRAPGYALRTNGRVPVVCRVSSYAPLLRSALGKHRSLADSFADWLEVRQVLDAEASFAPSCFVAEHFARLEGHRPAILRSPVNRLDAEPDDSWFRAKVPPSPYLLYFGTLSAIKGVDLVAEALPPVLAAHPRLHAVFVGRDDGLLDGSSAMETIRARCGQVSDRISHAPPLSKAMLMPVIASAVGVLMPSRVDNYPNACLEAQALGVPVVGTDNSSLEEMIEDGTTGFLAKNGDPESLAATIERLLVQTPTERNALAERIRSKARARMAEDRIGQLIAFYRSTIETFVQRAGGGPVKQPTANGPVRETASRQRS